MSPGNVLAAARLVDLTQPLGPATVLWPGSPPFGATVIHTYERDGAYGRTLAFDEHSGTHIDAPGHFGRGRPLVDELALAELVRPAVALDVRDRCGGDPAFTLTAADLAVFEERDGRVPEGSAVLVCTGWDAYRGDPGRYVGDPPAFPGISTDAARLLVERGVAGIGIDTVGIDPGFATEFPVHRITQPAGIWHLEGLVDLHRLPPRGAWLVVGAPPIVAASGTPVRAFAVLP